MTLTVGDVPLSRSERFALRRLPRQLVSASRKDADREVLYLDGALARSLVRKGMVTDLHGRDASAIVLDHRGRVISRDGKAEYHVPAILTVKAIRMLDGLQRIKGG